MKKIAILIALFPSIIVIAQDKYWQQEVNYTIKVSLNDKDHVLNGDVNMVYTNNSPDKLDFIWFHLWPNAYKNENTAYAKQIMRDKDGKKTWKEMKDRGSIDGLNFMVNGEKASTLPDPDNIDIVKLNLPKPLNPGDKITITTPFIVKIPSYASRSGHIEQSYMICQWYPKPAVYDRKGWHPIPYLDQGEFYSEFGSFDVSITVPSSYVVGATGKMQDLAEFNTYREIGKKNLNTMDNLVKYASIASDATKTLHYKAEQVHDFAWFADKDFIIRYDTAQLSSGKIIDVFTYGSEKGNTNWKSSVAYVEDAVRHYSTWIGEYPYPLAQAVEGPKNISSGGMEYPMITLITSPNSEEAELDGVITHEVGHNWFYGILASNERTHAWMDEGMNTYFQFLYEAEKYKANSIFGKMIPPDVKAKPLDEFRKLVYMALSQLPMEEPIETPAADFDNKDKYAIVTYIKTAIWMYIIESSIGPDKLSQVIQNYYNDWKFKHPYPEDLKAAFEKQLNMKFDDLFQLLNKKGKFGA